MEEFIRRLALQNAIKHEGMAQSNSIIGTVFGEFPESRNNKEASIKLVKKIVEEVNKFSVEEQTKQLMELNPDFFKEKEKKEELKELRNAIKNNVVMRFEPSPSGSLHIGHAYQLILNSEYAKMYNGKLIVRISDTNPDNIAPEAYDLIKEDALWLTENNIHDFVIQSDRMELYYGYALQLIEKGNAYVCTCPVSEWKEIVKSKSNCPCRSLRIDIHIKRWHDMFDKDNGYQSGDAVVRCKTNMEHKNPALRDFPLLRINDTEHVRTGYKYRVWPLLNFAVPIDDSENGVTHVLRGKDHYDNTKRQNFIIDYLKLNTPEYLHTGRINFIGLPLSSTDARAGIKEGKYEGWHDIRLPFLQALKKRGYQPEAFRKFYTQMGVTMVDKSVDGNEFFKSLNHFNKEIIDSKARRYFFIRDPVRIVINNAPRQEVELDLHPQFEKGGRKFKTHLNFYIEKNDFEQINNQLKDGELIRLMDCLNFIKKGDELEFVSTDYEDFKKEGKLIIHWLSTDHCPKIAVRMLDNSVIEGLAESAVENIEDEEMVQFERFGFCRRNGFEFWFGHR